MKYEGRYKFRAFKKDANSPQVAMALKTARIDYIDAAKYGFPCDFIIPQQGKIYMVELKDGAKSASQKELTDDEKELKAMLERNGCKFYVVESPEQMLELFD